MNQANIGQLTNIQSTVHRRMESASRDVSWSNLNAAVIHIHLGSEINKYFIAKICNPLNGKNVMSTFLQLQSKVLHWIN